MNYVEVPQPVRRTYGASLGRQNVLLEEQILNLLSPPKTDLGKVNDFKWPFSLSHNRLTQGGWARQQNGELFLLRCERIMMMGQWIAEKRLPFAKDLAGECQLLIPSKQRLTTISAVNMRLKAGAIRCV